MSSRYLLVTVVLLIGVGVAITTHSTLTPERGVDHVFYGDISDFMAQEATVGNFNGDLYDDIVTTLLWDDPSTCDATLKTPPYDSLTACTLGWGTRVASKAGQTSVTICAFTDSAIAAAQEKYWTDCGWTLSAVGSCGECTEAFWQNENKGAAYIFMGGDWSGKPRDFDMTTVAPDHRVIGANAGDRIYNGLGAGDVNADEDNFDDLVIGAHQDAAGPGEVYVIGGAATWPATISPPNDPLVDYVFQGRDEFDAFGKGIAVGDLNFDGNADIVVSAPYGDGKNATKPGSGEICIFYSVAALPMDVDLSTYVTDQGMLDSTSTYLQVIWGATDLDQIGLTDVRECHEGYPGHLAHCGSSPSSAPNYEPVGLAIGNWNGDLYNDLAIGAGHAEDGTGAVYVIFGADPNVPSLNKLRPGNTIDLAHAPSGSNLAAPDIKIVGKTGARLGAGVEFVDADAQGNLLPPERKDDLIVGAPYTRLGGDSNKFEYYGEAYIIFGDDMGDLIAGAPGSTPRNRNVGTASHVDVTIMGEGIDDQLGGHFAGDFDVDHDLKNDIGLACQDVVYVLFGQPRSDWESTVDLATVLQTNPETKVLKWIGDPLASSTTIKFLNLDGDDYRDLVFGGYDLPGKQNQVHAGQMWVTKGWDMWKKGSIASNTTWSGNLFVNGDIVVQSGVTLTIAAGTHVWIWQGDATSGGVDHDRIEFNVEGTLVANGTTANPIVFDPWAPQTTEDWGGFYFDNASGGGTFNHCTIKRAEYAIESYVPLAVRNTLIADCRYSGIVSKAGTAFIKDCTLTNPGSFGIFLTAGSATVRNTTVDNAVATALYVQPSATLVARNSQFLNSDKGLFVGGNTSANVDSACAFKYNNIGIHCYNASTGPQILRSAIENNSSNGILCDQGSQPLIQENTLRYNAVAIQCSNSSHPTVHSNMIKSNTVGMKTMTGSEPDASGGNTFAYTTSKHIINYGVDITIYAWDNCWNNNTPPCAPPANRFLGDVNRDFPVCCSVSQSSPLSERLPDPDGKPVAVNTGLTAIVPNPFNPTTTVHYGLAAQGAVKIVIYDVAGRFVRELMSGPQAAGRHEALWDGTDARGTPLASGVYFVRMSAGSGTYTKKMVLLK